MLHPLVLKNGRDALILGIEVSYGDDIKPAPGGLAAHLCSAFVPKEVRCTILLHDSAPAVNLCPINYVSGHQHFQGPEGGALSAFSSGEIWVQDLKVQMYYYPSPRLQPALLKT